MAKKGEFYFCILCCIFYFLAWLAHLCRVSNPGLATVALLL